MSLTGSLLYVLVTLRYMGIYGNGQIGNPYAPYPYFTLFTNISQMWAMYNLGLFYVTCKDELAFIHPLPKFLSVKAVVFFTFFQSVAIAGLEKLSVVCSTATYTLEDTSAGLQNFLICFEMFVAAGVHWAVFHHGEFTAVVSEEQVLLLMISPPPPSSLALIHPLFSAPLLLNAFI